MVKSEVVYRAKVMQTGEILESDTFKDLYNALRSFFRAELGLKTYYDYRSAFLEIGVNCYGMGFDGGNTYVSLKQLAFMMMSVFDRSIHEYFERCDE